MFANATMNSRIAKNLYHQGWAMQADYFDPLLIGQLAAEATQLYQTNLMTRASIGRGDLLHQNLSIRRDFIHWLNHDSKSQQQYQSLMETLRQSLNESLYLGLFEFEAHYAVFEAGAFYKKHLDSFRGNANRIVSVVVYLNADWPDAGGGELLIYAADGSGVELQRIRPKAGTLVVFLSEEMPHEVNVTHHQRASIAGWFKLNVHR
ncbi:MAG: 2OG-Fe(II) oxygenase [Methylococcaceae bacterium]|nr:2OG-Fe(II) oxygenase [Methylococcaceae bacterium]